MQHSRLLVKERTVEEAMLQRKVDAEKISHEQNRLHTELQQSASAFSKILGQLREIAPSTASYQGKNLSALLKRLDEKRAIQDKIVKSRARGDLIVRQYKALRTQRANISTLLDRLRRQRQVVNERSQEEVNLELFSRKAAPAHLSAPVITLASVEQGRPNPVPAQPPTALARAAHAGPPAALSEISPGSFLLSCMLGNKELRFMLHNVQPGVVQVNFEKQAQLSDGARRELLQCIERELSRRGLRIGRSRTRRDSARGF